jgi:hypothetical protein
MGSQDQKVSRRTNEEEQGSIVMAMKLPGVTYSMVKSTIFEDNNGAISTATAVRMTPHTKHIAMKYHFFKLWKITQLESRVRPILPT